jgi:hypothetical protein
VDTLRELLHFVGMALRHIWPEQSDPPWCHFVVIAVAGFAGRFAQNIAMHADGNVGGFIRMASSRI